MLFESFFLSIRDILLDNQKFEIAYLFSWIIFLISMIADFITTQISFQIKGLSERNQFQIIFFHTENPFNHILYYALIFVCFVFIIEIGRKIAIKKCQNNILLINGISMLVPLTMAFVLIEISIENYLLILQYI